MFILVLEVNRVAFIVMIDYCVLFTSVIFFSESIPGECDWCECLPRGWKTEMANVF